MKKSIFILAALTVSVVAKAWNLGDFVTDDATGVPALVVYVDESGEHGLLMSPKAFTEKEYKKFVADTEKSHSANLKWEQKQRDNKSKKGIDITAETAEANAKEARYQAVMLWQTKAPRLFEAKQDKKQHVQINKDLAELTTGRGDDNQKLVAAYCEKNNINKAVYFPADHWAAQLGGGWFIPGNDDLEQMLLNGVKGIGSKYNITQQEMMAAAKEFAAAKEELAKTGKTSNKSLMMRRNYVSGFAAFGMLGLLSSTMRGGVWDQQEANKEKVGYVLGANIDLYYVLATMSSVAGNANYWAFSSGVKETEIVAFKRF